MSNYKKLASSLSQKRSKNTLCGYSHHACSIFPSHLKRSYFKKYSKLWREFI